MKQKKLSTYLSLFLILLMVLSTVSSCHRPVGDQEGDQLSPDATPNYEVQKSSPGLSLKNDFLELTLAEDGKNFNLLDLHYQGQYASAVADEDLAGVKGVMKLKLKSLVTGSYFDRNMQKETEFYSANQDVDVSSELVSQEDRDILRLHFLLKVGLAFDLDLELKQDQLLVRINRLSIKESDRFVFKKFSLTPNLFAAGPQETGYFLLPDGCGGLLQFNNARKGVYDEPVYGINKAFIYPAYAANHESIYLPVYGVEREGETSLAVISQGAGCARVFAADSGNESTFNRAYANFIVRAEDKQYITEDSFQSILEEDLNLSSDLEITYLFCPNRGGYSAMAKRLKQKLQEDGGKQALTTDPLVLSIYGGVAEKGKILGVPLYEKVGQVSSPALVEEIVGQLTDWSGYKPQVRLVAWDKNTVLGFGLGKFSPVGSQAELKKLLADFDQRGVQSYLSLPMLSFNRSGKGLRVKHDAIRNLANEPSRQYQYYRASNSANRKRPTGYLLAADRLESRLNLLQDSLTTWDFSGLASQDLGRIAYANYRKGQVLDRDGSLADFSSALIQLGDRSALAVSGGYYYSLPAANLIFDAPTTSSNYDIMDAEVPFYQMVLSGFKSYCGPNINQAGNRKKAILQALETGSCLHYGLAGETAYLEQTELENLYGGSWELGQEQIKQEVKQYSRDLARVLAEPIDQHKILAPGLHQTKFANGLVVTINYTDKATHQAGYDLEPLSYVIEGSE